MCLIFSPSFSKLNISFGRWKKRNGFLGRKCKRGGGTGVEHVVMLSACVHVCMLSVREVKMPTLGRTLHWVVFPISSKLIGRPICNCPHTLSHFYQYVHDPTHAFDIHVVLVIGVETWEWEFRFGNKNEKIDFFALFFYCFGNFRGTMKKVSRWSVVPIYSAFICMLWKIFFFGFRSQHVLQNRRFVRLSFSKQFCAFFLFCS